MTYKTYKSYIALAFSAGELLAEVYLFGLVAGNLDVYTFGRVGYAYALKVVVYGSYFTGCFDNFDSVLIAFAVAEGNVKDTTAGGSELVLVGEFGTAGVDVVPGDDVAEAVVTVGDIFGNIEGEVCLVAV